MPEGQANDEQVVGQLAEVWGSVIDACRDVTEEQWSLPTDCPGWTVRDQVSHLVAVERMLLGDPAPPSLPTQPPHVKNPIGELNEPWIEARRGTPGQEVLAEFEETVQRRLDALRAFPPERFDVVGWSPVGEVPYRDFMTTRILDSWAHEQDIRAALHRPGGRNGVGETVVLDRCEAAMGYVVGKKVAPLEGTVVWFAISGPLGRDVVLRVEAGRASRLHEPYPDPTVTLSMDQTAFWRVCFGRDSGDEAVRGGDVIVSGHSDLGRQVVDAMAFMV